MTAVVVNSLTVLEGNAANTATTNKNPDDAGCPSTKEQTVIKGCQPRIEIAAEVLEALASKHPPNH